MMSTSNIFLPKKGHLGGVTWSLKNDVPRGSTSKPPRAWSGAGVGQGRFVHHGDLVAAWLRFWTEGSTFHPIQVKHLFGDFEHNFQVFVGDNNPNIWVMFNEDIYPPLFKAKKGQQWWVWREHLHIYNYIYFFIIYTYIYICICIAQHLAKKTKDVRESVTQGPSKWPYSHVTFSHFAQISGCIFGISTLFIGDIQFRDHVLDPLTLHQENTMCKAGRWGCLCSDHLHGGFHLHGGTLKSSTGNKIVPDINHSAIGVLPLMETPTVLGDVQTSHWNWWWCHWT